MKKTYLLLISIIFLFLLQFVYVKKASAFLGLCAGSSSDCGCNQSCFAVKCTTYAGTCAEGITFCGGPTGSDLYEAGYHYNDNHECVVDKIWDGSNMTDPDNFCSKEGKVHGLKATLITPGGCATTPDPTYGDSGSTCKDSTGTYTDECFSDESGLNNYSYIGDKCVKNSVDCTAVGKRCLTTPSGPECYTCGGGAGGNLSNGINTGTSPEYYTLAQNYPRYLTCNSNTYTCPTGSATKVHLWYDTQSGNDPLTIYNGSGGQLEQLSGSSGGYVWKGPYSSSTLKFGFSSDASASGLGFYVDQIECIAPCSISSDGTCIDSGGTEYKGHCSAGNNSFWKYKCAADNINCEPNNDDYPADFTLCGSGTCSEASGSPICVASPINGSCGATPTHYNCIPGDPVSQTELADRWTWTCNGSGGGSNASCSEMKSTTDPACGFTYDTCPSGTSTGNDCSSFGEGDCKTTGGIVYHCDSDSWNSIANCSGITPTPIPTSVPCAPVSNPPSISCDVPGNSISWSPVVGADHYPVRVDSDYASWTTGPDCTSVSPGDVCENIYTNSRPFTFGVGKSYRVWAHSISSCDGSWGTGTVPEIICNGPTPTSTPSPTPIPTCLVTTSPAWLNLTVGGTMANAIQATVTNLPAGRSVAQMNFGSYNTAIATATTPDVRTPFYTTIRGIAVGNTAVWATATLDNGDVTSCQSTGGTDTDISVTALPVTPTFTPTPTLTPTPTPIPTYTISGRMFKDNDGDGTRDASETTYYNFTTSKSGTSLIDTYNTGGTPGTYFFMGLSAGNYTVTFGGLPSSLIFTYPPANAGCPESSKYCLAVTLPCSALKPPPSGATCSLGSVFNLNAGVTDIKDSWVQTKGSDLRWDSGGFINKLPSSSSYVSLPGTKGGMPGILFSGGKEGSSPTLGLGKASEGSKYGWTVGSSSYPDVFTDAHSLIPTSYAFLSETANGSGIKEISISALTEIGLNGIYKREGDLIVSETYNFKPGNYIILVNGDLRINKKIKVPVGSTAMFSVSGDIWVSSAIGEAASDDTTTTIEGLYSADGNFYATDKEPPNDCSTGIGDLRLNIAGSVVANAKRQGKTFVNKRTLCSDNSLYPSVSFIERPDFILNYPSFVKQIPRSWSEVAP